MQAVRTQQKYKCDFCKRRSTKAVMTKHERRCFRNPNRYCDHCENKGYTDEKEGIYTYKAPCQYCSQRDPKIEEAIKNWEASCEPRGIVLPDKGIPF